MSPRHRPPNARPQTLHVFARVGPGGGEKLEFLFAARSDATPPLFAAAERVLRAYDGSRLYRDVKLRGALVVRGAPSLLPGETLISRHDDVWNLSGAAGADAGVMTVTNVRVVWHAGFAENFSVSVPFVQLVRVALRDTRAGAALVLQTSQRSGGIFLGFRVDAADSAARPSRRLDALHKVRGPSVVRRPAGGPRARACTSACAVHAMRRPCLLVRRLS